MKFKSVSIRIITILLLSLMPFIIGISISIINSGDMAYFGQAINISGSQRMRTMLLANYAQQYESAVKSDNMALSSDLKAFLNNEIAIYERYMTALIEGDDEMDLIKNSHLEIVKEIQALRPLLDAYVLNVRALLDDPSHLTALEFVKETSLPLKNQIHNVVEAYEEAYSKNIQLQKTIDISMITIAIVVTFSGFLLTRLIKKHEYLANFDYLTGLQNRNSLYAYLEDKKTKDFNVFFLDLNKFKVINDTFGHAIGDEVLIEVSSRLRIVFGEDQVFRFGGDEFVVIDEVVEKNRYHIDDLSLQIKRALSNPIIDSQNRHHYVGVSMGIASNAVNIKDWDKLIDFADELMYDSKNFTGHIVICDESIDANTKMNLSEEIEKAFELKEIQPHFQTVFRADSSQVVLFTAIARWHREFEVLDAAEFIPIARRRGLLYKLDKHMLRAVNEFYMSLPDNHKLKKMNFMINISQDTLINANSNGFFEVLDSLKMPYERLGLKFIEYVLLDENIDAIITKLSAYGLRLIVDNFTIDVSLKESKTFKYIDVIQLGKVTVDALMVDDYSRKTLKEFIKMLVSVDKRVIIEGLKDNNEVAVLKAVLGDFDDHLYYSKEFELLTKEALMIQGRISS